MVTMLVFDLSLITESEIMMTIVGMSVVFCVLFLLYAVFSNLPRLLNLRLNFKKAAAAKEEKYDKAELTGEINAAISMALYLYLEEQHDEEEMVLTQEKVSRIYSPWSSKIYGVMHSQQ